jgi:hypothetical protein
MLEKAAHLAAIQDLLDSSTNKQSDTWPAPVKYMANTPPGSPTTGDRYAVGPTPGGAWTGKANYIATANGGGWDFLLPPLGSLILCTDAPDTLLERLSDGLRTLRFTADVSYRQTGTQTVSSTSLQEVGSLSGTLASGRSYRLECNLLVQCSSTATGLKVGLAGPTCATLAIHARVPTGAATTATGDVSAYGQVANGGTLPAASSPLLVRMEAMVCGTTATDLVTVLLATNDVGNPITVLAGSFLKVTDITS